MSVSAPKTLYLIDATAQLFRAYFALPGLTNAEGLPTHAVYGFTTMLRKLLKEEQPEYVASAFDLSGVVFRHETFADYKANRPPVPQDLEVQVPYAKQVSEILGVRVLEEAGYEADDLIATYAARARREGYAVVVVAADKDLLQLVGPGVTLLNPVKNLRLDADGVTREFGVPPERVIDVLGLMGDSVDNVPGVPGVGEKTALAAVSSCGDLECVLARAARFVALFDARDAMLGAIEATLGESPERTAAAERLAVALDAFVTDEPNRELAASAAHVRELLRNLDGSPGAAAPKLLRELKRELKGLERGTQRRLWYAIHEHRERARLSRSLAKLHDDAPARLSIEELARRPADSVHTVEFFRTLGFRTLVEREQEAGAPAVVSGQESPVRSEIARDVADVERIVSEVRRAGRVALLPRTEGSDALGARLVGLALAWREGHAAIVPAGPLVGALEPVLGDPAVEKVTHDLKRALHLFTRHGVNVDGWSPDVMVAAFLLDPGRASYALDRLCAAYLDVSTTPVRRGATQLALELVPDDGALSGEGQAAERILRLAARLEPRLDAAGLRQLYRTIDGPLLPVLARMEARGIGVDSQLLGVMSQRMEGELGVLRGEIHALAGGAFNIDSPKQLREVLFERLGMAAGRKTEKSRVASTDAETLEQLAAEHAIARKILEYRELAKLRGTYVDALPRLVRPESGRVHTWFDPTGAATGRLSSQDPNLQNIPVRTSVGRQIRAAFVPAPGYVFLSSDYSQVELRILAHLSRDEGLIAAFREGEDIHRYTAARVFGVRLEAVDDRMRRRAKAVNFGILYGMSETRLAREQGMVRSEARQFIHAYFERFSGVRRYIDETRARARSEGAVRTLFGRIRRFPQLHQQAGRAEQEQALRAAVNTTIQGTAADLMKLAMLRVDAALGVLDPRARILLQVHDELLLEVPEERVAEVRPVVREAMEAVGELIVPLAVVQKVGRNWLEAT